MNCKSVFILMICLMLVGCSSDQPYVAPEKAESPQVQEKQQEIETKKDVEKQIPQKTLKVFNVGESASDDQLKITVNGVRFTSTIDEQNNEYLVAQAPDGEIYAIVDVTIENMLSDTTQSVSTLMQTTINDEEGYNYDFDFTGFTALGKGFKDGEILPSMKKRGELVYQVPKDASDLKFVYRFDLLTGTSAVFDVK